MNAFLQLGNRVGSIKQFVEASDNGNGLRYRGDVGVSHLVYFPYKKVKNDDDGTVTKELIALQAGVHDWTTTDGKYHATICTNGKVLKDKDGTVLFDGTCPFCNRVSDAWEIYKYRMKYEEETCGLTGDALAIHLRGTEDKKKQGISTEFNRERKVKEAKSFMYVLVALIETDNNLNPVIGQDGVPAYSLKVMRLSEGQVEKLTQALKATGDESLCGMEFVFAYPAIDSGDRNTQLMQAMQQRTVNVRGEKAMVSVKFPEFANHVNEDARTFEWDGLERAFPEFTEISASSLKKTVEDMFTEWDKYAIEKKEADEKRKNGEQVEEPLYLEYAKSNTARNPALSTTTTTTTGGVEMPKLGSGTAFTEEMNPPVEKAPLSELDVNMEI